MNIKKLINPDDPLYTLRKNSSATVTLRISYSRYLHGEVVIETIYLLEDGTEDRDPTSRIFLGEDHTGVITQLWDKLFDAVLVAREYDIKLVVIDFHRVVLETWDRDLLIAVLIVAHELQVQVSGILFAHGLVQPDQLRNLSADLGKVLYDEDENCHTIKSPKE